jgi:hypothetical protein
VTILYIETNFLIAIAKGQDPHAEPLILNPPSSLRIFIPKICYVESVSVFKLEKQARLSFEKEMNNKIREARRDNSNHAQSLYRNLEQAIIDNQLLLNDIENRLCGAMDRQRTRVRCIYLNNDILQDTCSSMISQGEQMLIKNDIMDNLILKCILNDASWHCKEEKAFISNNTKDFDKPEIREALRDAGIRYFTITQHFLDWFNSCSST